MKLWSLQIQVTGIKFEMSNCRNNHFVFSCCVKYDLKFYLLQEIIKQLLSERKNLLWSFSLRNTMTIHSSGVSRFPSGGSANPQGGVSGYDFVKISWKLHENSASGGGQQCCFLICFKSNIKDPEAPQAFGIQPHLCVCLETEFCMHFHIST